MNWIQENKDWIFEGIGVFLIALIIAFVAKNKKREKEQQVIKNKGDSNSIFQIQNTDKFKIKNETRNPKHRSR